MSHWTEELFVEHADHYAADLEATTDAAEEQVDDLLDLLADDHDLAPETALDVACGIGRHAVPLADRGLDVDGLDLSPEFLDRARDRAAEAGVADRTRFVEGDVRDLAAADLRADYDLVTCLYTSFGFFDDATNREVLAAMADRVAPDGALVVEVTNKEGLLARFADSGVFEQDEYLVTEQREYDPATSCIETTRRMFEASDCESGGDGEDGYDLAVETTFSLRLYAPVELRRLFEDARLEPHFYGGFDGEGLERESARLLVVGRA